MAIAWGHQANGTPPVPAVCPHHLARICFTGGPKCLQYTWGGVFSQTGCCRSLQLSPAIAHTSSTDYNGHQRWFTDGLIERDSAGYCARHQVGGLRKDTQ
jgi:hypothetical protein